MDPIKRAYWRVVLRGKLRDSHGDAFQDFVASTLEKAHGGDFVRVTAFGKLGDKGCDGYLASSGTMFACYGSKDAASAKVDYLVGKIDADFKKAKSNFLPPATTTALMKSWAFTHNFVGGLPSEAVTCLSSLKAQNPAIPISYFGPERLEETILSLPEAKIADLLGPPLTSDHFLSIAPAAIRDVVNAVEAQIHSTSKPSGEVRPVSSEKLQFNKLPDYWSAILVGGWAAARLVRSYLDHDPLDPARGERIAAAFRARYEELKQQSLSPDAIMERLYEFGSAIPGHISPQRNAAVIALLAHFFESCDIFEDAPSDPSVEAH